MVDGAGRPTPAWFRFFVSLVARTGGNAGRVTPIPQDPQMLLMGLLTQEDAVDEQSAWFPQDVNASVAGGGGGVGWGLVDGVEPPTVGMTLGDVAKPQQQVLQLVDVVESPPLQVFYPDQSNPAAVDGVTPGASPYTYSPGEPGFALITGGTVSSITWTRDGSTFLTTGMTSGFFPLECTDSLVITYTVAPTVNFLQRAR